MFFPSQYYQRGFDAFVVDPYCSHEGQCFENGSISAEESDSQHIKVANWKAHDLTPEQQYHEIWMAQCQNDRSDKRPYIYICQHQYAHSRTSFYSAALIEKSDGHAIEYFAKRDNWTDERRQEVMSCPDYLRLVCKNCRKEYGLQLVLDEVPSTVASVETVEDLLHGEFIYRNSTQNDYLNGHGFHFSPSFYSGGAFDSAYVGRGATSIDKLLAVMRGQHIIEEARHIRKHGSIEGYKTRFVYSKNLETVFADAANHTFPFNGRAPVGLNPERFIARCKGCQQWLHGCECSVEYCESCSDSKPAAAGD